MLRIDSERVLFFERTTDPIAFMRGIATYAPLIAPAPLPSMKALPQGVSYEFALLYPVPGRAPQWAIYVHTKEKTHVTIVSENDPQIFVPIKEINRSLGRSSFYRAHNESSAANAVYADLKALPIRGSGALALAKAIVTPYSRIMLTWKGGNMNLIAEKKTPVLFTRNRPSVSLLTLPNATPFSLASNDPAALLTSLNSALGQRDAKLADGLKGVVRNMIDEATHRSDLAGITTDLFSEPARLAVVRQGDAMRTLLIGRARNAKTLNMWINGVRAMTTPTEIRTQHFFKENIRTDVKPAETEELKTTNGWSVVSVGASGSNMRLIIAVHDDQFAVSDDRSLLETGIGLVQQSVSLTPRPSARTFIGSADPAWVLSAADSMVPFLANDLRSLTHAIFGKNIAHLSWVATDGASAATLTWSISPLTAPVNASDLPPRKTGKR